MPKRRISEVDLTSGTPAPPQQPWILSLPRELLDTIAAYVAEDYCKKENCPISHFSPRPDRAGRHDESTHEAFRQYRASRNSLFSIMLSCRTLSPSAGRALYSSAVITTPLRLALLLRSLAVNDASWKSIKHLEISLALDPTVPPPGASRKRSEKIAKAMTDIIDSTASGPIHWITHLRECCKDYLLSESSPSLPSNNQSGYRFLLALLERALHLRTLYLAVPSKNRDSTSKLPIGTRFMAQLQKHRRLHALCPLLEHIYLTMAGSTRKTNETALDIQVFQPLLGLGKVTKLTILEATLALKWPGTRKLKPIGESLYESTVVRRSQRSSSQSQRQEAGSSASSAATAVPTTVPHNALHAIKELTLDAVSGPADQAWLALSHLLGQADNLQVLKIPRMKEELAHRWRDYPDHDSASWEDIIGSRSTLRHLDLCQHILYAWTWGVDENGTTGIGMKSLYDFTNLTTLRVPIVSLFGISVKVAEESRLRPSPYLERLRIYRQAKIPPLPPKLTKLILLEDSNDMVKSCEFNDIGHWDALEEVDDPELLSYYAFKQVTLISRLRKSAPWVKKVDICAAVDRLCECH